MATKDELELALRQAIPHVQRQVYAGKHVQDRSDAVVWLKEHEAIVAELQAQQPAATTSSRPRCPQHPAAAILNVKFPGVGRFWACLICAMRLGPAPDRDDDDDVDDSEPELA